MTLTDLGYIQGLFAIARVCYRLLTTMTTAPPINPDIRRQLKERLIELSPRAFELFAGDLLIYIGLQNVAVTRYTGDGGIDAQGDLVADSGLARVPTGVQVKRHRQNVGRPDIDRFIGALSGKYHHGIFITTSNYATQARVKSLTSPMIRVDTVDGNQVIKLMLQHELGITETAGNNTRIDESYFAGFETQDTGNQFIHEQSAQYRTSTAPTNGMIAQPQDDLITMRALSYALRIDTTTIRSWIERGRLNPDRQSSVGERNSLFFRRDRIEAIRREFFLVEQPQTSTEWRQAFLDFTRSRRLTRSYKPVLLKSLLSIVDRNGTANIDEVVQNFYAFYMRRHQHGYPVEFGTSLLEDLNSASFDDIKHLVIRYPLDRFLIQGFLEYLPQESIIRFSPILWHELRFHDIIDILKNLDDQLLYYFNRHIRNL